MKSSVAILLQVVVVLIGIGAVVLLVWEPLVEGRNAHASLIEIYFEDPFLAFAYIASIPFFVALYQAFRLPGYVARDRQSLMQAMRSLRTIRLCAIAIIACAAIGEVIIMMNDSDDRAGGVFIGVLIAFGALLVAATAKMFERRLR
jgi:hypothetical protein